MVKKMKKRVVLAVIVEVICLILLGVLLITIHRGMTVSEQRSNTEDKLREVEETVTRTAKEAAEEELARYDEFHMAQAESIAYMYQSGAVTERTNSALEELAELEQAENIRLLDTKGNTIAKGGNTPSDFTRERYNQLRTVFQNGGVSDPFEVTFDEVTYRYYGAYIDDETMVVVEKSRGDLDEILANVNTWESMLSDVNVGLDGYAFAISAKDYTFSYHPDESLIGQDALEAGIPVEELEKDNYTWLTVNGEKVYAGITLVEDTYVACAVTEDEIAASSSVTAAVILFVFFSVSLLVIAYAVLLALNEDEEKEKREEEEIHFPGGMKGKKVAAVALAGLLVVVVCAFYMQTLFNLSRQSMSNNERAEDVETAIQSYQEDAENLSAQYDARFLNQCQTAGYILAKKPELAGKPELKELADVLDVEEIFLFDGEGRMTVTSSGYTRFELSEDPEDQSYEFRSLLSGVDYVIQEAQPDEVSGTYRQYFGVPLRDKDENVQGIVQISTIPESLEQVHKSAEISSVAQSVKVGKGGIIFAVNTDDHKFAYFPEERLNGRSALEYGLEEKQLKDGYANYITVGQSKYYASCLETDDYYIYVAVPVSSMNQQRLPITLMTTAFTFVSLLILFFILCIYKPVEKEKEAEKKESGAEGGYASRVVDVSTSDGRKKRSESAVSRWSNTVLDWSEISPEQQLGRIFQGLCTVFALALCVAVALKDTIFTEGSIFLYIFNGGWERGLNVFAITVSITIIFIVTAVAKILQKILKWLAAVMGTRGETLCRLLRNLVKYASVLIMLYYCLALFGVDTKTLLASAGILSLVVGLGAQTLISDILAGLFIIFEGEFRVGDIVTIGDYRGTVVEIGIRTTKIQDGSQNIKVISNGQISGVINMTRKYSYAWCDFGIEYGESLERVENILQKEFPNLKRRYPEILEGPFYKGVIAMEDNCVTIRVMVLCSEENRIQMERDLNREIKLLCDKYEINIPYPQIVVHQPTTFKKASEWEKLRAEQFLKEQKSLSKDIIAEDDDEK